MGLNNTEQTLKDNFEIINKNIESAAKRSGRAKEDIALVAVTKLATVEQAKEAIALGIAHVGENRVIEADSKFRQLSDMGITEFTKHMIGRLQTNKAKLAVEIFDVIQSIDSLKTAKEVDKRAKNAGKLMPVFIEVNIGREESKTGIMPEETLSFYDKIIKLTNLKVDGLMCIAPFVSAEETRPRFREMKKLFSQLPLKWLSMGMTNDYVVAIEEGANMIRIGSALFGKL